MTAVRRILIVEDHKPLRSLLSFLLSNAGYETFETANAMSALDEASRQQPDLVLLDWQLPDMDGIKLLRLWRSDEATARIPVIMVSGKADEGGPGGRTEGRRRRLRDEALRPGRAAGAGAGRAAARGRHPGGRIRTCGASTGLSLDVRSLRVTAGEQPVHLGPIEFKMLNLFMTHPERVLSRVADRRPGVAHQRPRGRADGGRARQAPAPGPGADGPRRVHPDGAGRRLPALADNEASDASAL